MSAHESPAGSHSLRAAIIVAAALVLAGCTGFSGDRADDEANQRHEGNKEAFGSLPVIAVFNNLDEAVVVTVEITQQNGANPPRQVYQAIMPDESRTPPASMDPSCGPDPLSVHVEAHEALSADSLGTYSIPFNCGPDEFVVFVTDDPGVVMYPAAQFDVPPTWSRGDNWPWATDGSGRPPPQLVFDQDDAEGVLMVAEASHDADWHHLVLESMSACGYVLRQGDHGTGIRPRDAISRTEARVAVGDYIEMDIDDPEGCTFTISHSSGNATWGPFHFDQSTSNAPAMSFTISETNDRATVSSATPGTTWAEFTIQLSAPGGFAVNDEPSRVPDAEDSPQPTDTTDPVRGGDFINFCAADASGPLEATLIHTDSNTVVRSVSLRSVAGC